MKRIENVLERIRAKRINRGFSVRADDEDWVTIKGTHVLLGEEGEALSGGKLKGTKFTRAKSTKSKAKTQKAPQGLKTGKNSIKIAFEKLQYFDELNVDIDGERWTYKPSVGAFVKKDKHGTRQMSAEEYRKKYGDEINVKPFKGDEPSYFDFVGTLTKSAEQSGSDQFKLFILESSCRLSKSNLEEAEKKYKEDPSEKNAKWLERCKKALKLSEENYRRAEEKDKAHGEYLKAVIQAYEATGQSALSPDEFIGNKRGKEMSHEEADNGNVNPNYTPGSMEYTSNCQTCVVAYEARLRGYDVQAGPFTAPGPMYELAKASHTAWIDPTTGRPPSRIQPKTSDDLIDGESCGRWLSKQMEEGARYTVRMTWLGTNSGHVICCEKRNGQVVLYDPQRNKSYDDDIAVSIYFHRVDPLSISLVRVDNMIMNPMVLEGCFAKKK